jgi:hypothetical protein
MSSDDHNNNPSYITSATINIESEGTSKRPFSHAHPHSRSRLYSHLSRTRTIDSTSLSLSLPPSLYSTMCSLMHTHTHTHTNKKQKRSQAWSRVKRVCPSPTRVRHPGGTTALTPRPAATRCLLILTFLAFHESAFLFECPLFFPFSFATSPLLSSPLLTFSLLL